MYDERKTNTVCVNSKLADRFPDIYDEVRALPVTVKLIQHENIWLRDTMPLQVDGHFVKFRLHDTPYSAYDMRPAVYRFLNDVHYSQIVLDGGNCQRNGNLAIITDVVFKDNPDIEKTRLVNRLETLLETQVIIIPREPYDPLGHSDGIVKFIPGTDTILLNDYPNRKLRDRYAKILCKAGLTVELFPYAYRRRPRLNEKEFWERYPLADDFNPGFGYYINFLIAGSHVLLPTFSIEEDAAAIKSVQKHFAGYTISAVDCTEVSWEGGLVNCLTMNYELKAL